MTISDLCSRTGVELPLRATTSTEPMTHTTSPQMSPSTRAVTSPTEISITSSSRSEIQQLPKQQTHSGMGKDGITDAASLVPEVKVKTELSDYSTPPKRRKIRKGEDYF